MTDGIGTPQDFVQFDRGRLSPIFLSLTVSGAGALVLGALVGALILYARIPAPSVDEVLAAAPAAKVAPKPRDFYGALAAAPVAPVAANSPNVYGTLAAAPAAIAAVESKIYGALVAVPVAPVADNSDVARLEPPSSANVPSDSLAQGALRGTDAESNQPASSAATGEAGNVPLPPPRPLGGGLLSSHAPLRDSGRQMAEEESTVIAATTPSDQRNFFEKMFGIAKSSGQSSGQVLAYAASEDGAPVDGGRPSAAVLPYGQETAVYDISAHTVYMPDGTKLEAHSGLGDRLDDPRHVDEKMRGATPPHVYALEPRAQLFHGIQALRLIPVGGGGLFGRTGLLAHSYMLGRKGASFGCVSFKDYNAFLQAYKKGEVKRLVVVAGLN